MIMSGRLSIEVPKLMRSLGKDSRGYPIPYLVMIDKKGQPQFTINDHTKAHSCFTKKLCAICGKRLDKGYWFVGGSRCFLHDRGAFVDPPVHLECGTYALQVCPFLALPHYGKRIDERKLNPENTPEGVAFVRYDGMVPNQPIVFGFGHTDQYKLRSLPTGETYFTVLNWNYVEWWKNGDPQNAPVSGFPPD